MSDKYIVTGGLGFIGSNMVRYLNSFRGLEEDNPRVVVCDRVRADRYKNISGSRVVDIIHPDDLITYIVDHRHTLKGIFHMGACSDTMNFGDEVMKKNFEFTRDLIDQCIASKVPLVYASSASVYGVQRESKEDAQSTPLNLYAFSKSMVDQYFTGLLETINLLSEQHRPKVVGLRYFNVYGPNEKHKGKMASVIYQKYREVKDKGYLRLFKPGDQRRDFIHVDDVCNVNWHAMKSAKPGIYNVGTGQAPTFTEVATAILENTYDEGMLSRVANAGYRVSQLIQYIDFPKELEGKYQDYTCADHTHLRSFYKDGFLDIKTGIKRAIEAYEAGQ